MSKVVTTGADSQQDYGRIILHPRNVRGPGISVNLGGKATSLCRLSSMGANVPEFYCVLDGFFELWANIVGWEAIEALAKSIPPINGMTYIEHWFAHQGRINEIPQDAINVLLAGYDLVVGNAGYVSVRSSARCEDSQTASYAGLFQTFLYVTKEQLVEKVLLCFLSGISRNLESYSGAQSSAFNQLGSVVVQQIVDSEFSGVMFTANPISYDRNEAVITAGWGIGEGVVADRVEVDTVYYGKLNSCVKQYNFNEKTRKITLDKQQGFGTTEVPVTKEKQAIKLIDEHLLQELVDVGTAIESYYEHPQDIEWAVDDTGQLYILQSRPITNIPSGDMQIFDNSNVCENYPGVISPLTYSFTRRCYQKVAENAMRALGADEDTIARCEIPLRNIVAYLDGHIYYNVTSWYALYAQLPGVDITVSNWEKTLGLPPHFSNKGNKALVEKVRYWFNALNTVVHVAKQYFTLDREAEKWISDIEFNTDSIRSLPLDTMNSHELYRTFCEFEQAFHRRSYTTVMNDFFAFIYFYLFEKLIKSFGVDDAENVKNALMTNEQDLFSAKPVLSIIEMVHIIRRDPDLFSLFAKDSETILSGIRNGSKFANISQLFDRHIADFGDRGVRELVLECPAPRQIPTLLIDHVKSYLQSTENGVSFDTRKKTRVDMESKLVEKMRYPWQRPLFNHLFKQCRTFVARREHLRYARTMGFSLTRSLLSEIGTRMVREHALKKTDDIFQLSVEEIEQHLYGASLSRSLTDLVAARRNAYPMADSMPERIVTRGAVNSHKFENINQSDDVSENTQDGVTTGIACSTGRIRAPIKIVHNPDEAGDIQGHILVAKMTDPGWVYLMIASRGMIVERGNVLSHTAIIGRELGIPTIVNVKHATKLFNDGDVVEMDGETGKITLIQRANFGATTSTYTEAQVLVD